MSKRIKFTVGSLIDGYKTVEIFIEGCEVTYKILRSGLLDLDRNKKIAAQIPDEWLEELEELEIFSWEKNYFADVTGGVQWELIFDSGRENYRGQGSNAYPENFECFLDWLDALIPELEFVNRKRLKKFTLTYAEEILTLDRREKTLTLEKKKSRHIYDAGEDIKKLFDSCQKFLDCLEIDDAEINSDASLKFELVHHDGTIKNFCAACNEKLFPNLTNCLEEIHSLASDLTAEIFSPKLIDVISNQSKYIFCKVQFKGSYKHYTYQADDETLSVGDVVDVPVGKNNDVATARIVEIGYFDEYEAPFPVDKIKKIIGKHIADEWENY